MREVDPLGYREMGTDARRWDSQAIESQISTQSAMSNQLVFHYRTSNETLESINL